MTAIIDRSACPAQAAESCELLYLCSLPTKQERADYLARGERYDGKPAADALRTRLAQAWADAKRARAPIPCCCVVAQPSAPVHQAENTPGNGSSHSQPHAGGLRRVGGVDSDGAA